MKTKFIEETQELPPEITDKEAIAEELADLYRLVIDAGKVAGVSLEEIIAADAAKFAKKGGFKEGLFVKTITVHDKKWAEYYRKEPDKYPEIGD